MTVVPSQSSCGHLFGWPTRRSLARCWLGAGRVEGGWSVIGGEPYVVRLRIATNPAKLRSIASVIIAH
jgi:hypothetical protein